VSDRPRLGISACLLGQPVRYNAGHKRDDWLVDVLGPLVEWVAVCPEVEAGFGTPRETMQLVGKGSAGVALLTLGVACWRARDDTDSRATTGLVSAMSLYNAGVCAVLLYAAWVAKLSAVGLWPVAVAHAGLAAWCLASLAPRRLTG